MLKINYREPLAAELNAGVPLPGERDSIHAGSARDLEVWGGVECTINRVEDRFFDQLERSGHYHHDQHLLTLASLKIRALRYPVLWERTCPDGLPRADWSWADRRLRLLRGLGIEPIVGLVHHGSGPRHTSLLDPGFPEGLARYARAVAERYPWVSAYTPVNEPLTTARFSALYGHWYPHARDPLSFARALLHQCKAVVLAMREIRQVNPHARLVQTDDLGKTHSTPALRDQAEFENERRWLTWDLLTGRLGPGDRLWEYFLWCGVSPAELEWFRENPCPPDILGVNHYLTSERFLDERVERYPEWTHGSNGRQRYADVEAVRVCAEGPAGPEALLREAWERYHLPLAVTEAHLGCTREEQMRWLLEVWNAGRSLRAQGVDIRAVTAWSLLGAYDWNTLLTEPRGHYEPGVFDLRGGSPRATALAGMIRQMAAARVPDHPVLAQPGWWKRPERLLYPPQPRDASPAPPQASGASNPLRRAREKRLWITGGSPLTEGLVRSCQIRSLPHLLTGRKDVDPAVRFQVEDALDSLEPWAVIHTAGWLGLEDAARQPEAWLSEIAAGAGHLAAACARRGLPFLMFSSHLVFDATTGRVYLEDDEPSPGTPLGRAKAEAERRVREAHPGALIIRTGLLLDPGRDDDLHRRLGEAAGAVMESPAGLVSSVPDLVNAALDLLIDRDTGTWHLANPGLLPAGAHPVPAAPLGTARGALLPPLSEVLWRLREGRSAGGVQEPEGRTACLEVPV